jgi:hypothetical protein
VADFCSCGAQLPPDARFCHKCGKPQREEPLFDPDPEPVVETPPPAVLQEAAPPPPPEVSFRDSGAVRSALLAAIIGVVVMVLLGPVVGMAGPLAAGFLSVFFYARRTRMPVDLRNGLRLGWISGMIAFSISVVMFTLSMMVLLSDPQAVAMVKDRIQGMIPPAEFDQMLATLRTPVGILISLGSSFLTLTGLPMLGAAMGATLLGRQTPR